MLRTVAVALAAALTSIAAAGEPIIITAEPGVPTTFEVPREPGATVAEITYSEQVAQTILFTDSKVCTYAREFTLTADGAPLIGRKKDGAWVAPFAPWWTYAGAGFGHGVAPLVVELPVQGNTVEFTYTGASTLDGCETPYGPGTATLVLTVTWQR